jgi:hypothetical protein
MTPWIFAAFVLLLVALVWLVRRRIVVQGNSFWPIVPTCTIRRSREATSTVSPVGTYFPDLSHIGRAEAFVDAQTADPKEILQKVRGILSRYNDPTLWEHLETVAGRDIGQLARATAEAKAETAAKQ